MRSQEKGFLCGKPDLGRTLESCGRRPRRAEVEQVLPSGWQAPVRGSRSLAWAAGTEADCLGSEAGSFWSAARTASPPASSW